MEFSSRSKEASMEGSRLFQSCGVRFYAIHLAEPRDWRARRTTRPRRISKRTSSVRAGTTRRRRCVSRSMTQLVLLFIHSCFSSHIEGRSRGILCEREDAATVYEDTHTHACIRTKTKKRNPLFSRAINHSSPVRVAPDRKQRLAIPSVTFNVASRPVAPTRSYTVWPRRQRNGESRCNTFLRTM